MIHYEVSMYLKCPPQDVFLFLVDSEKLMRWQSDLVKSEILTEGPLRIGSRFHETRRMGQKEVDIWGEISDFTPNHLLATRTDTKPDAAVRYVLDHEDEGTRLHYEFNLRMTGLMRLMEPLIGKSIQKGTEADLQKLRQLVEG